MTQDTICATMRVLARGPTRWRWGWKLELVAPGVVRGRDPVALEDAILMAWTRDDPLAARGLELVLAANQRPRGPRVVWWGVPVGPRASELPRLFATRVEYDPTREYRPGDQP